MLTAGSEGDLNFEVSQPTAATSGHAAIIMHLLVLDL